MQGYWTSPQVPGEPAWRRFAAAAPLVQSLAEPRTQPAGSFAAEHHCAFWEQLAA